MLPTFFIGHGSPMNAIEKNDTTQKWIEIASRTSKPKLILAISAHWLTKGTEITGNIDLPTIHDFGGFPQELFDIQYSAKGNPELAQEIANTIGAKVNMTYGLDHGAWSVLAQIYPKADIPVLQLSLDYTKSSLEHFQLGQKLKYLRDQGVLILGSGNIVHNLNLISWNGNNQNNWATEFNSKIVQNLENKDYQAIINYQKYGEISQKSVPTPEHFWPLLYTLGASDLGDLKGGVEIFNNQIEMGSIAMTSVKFG